MKKFIVCGLLALSMLGLSGCNKQIIDTVWAYDYAYIDLGNGVVVEGKIESWNDYDNSDFVQVIIDGKAYYTHASNVVLVAD